MIEKLREICELKIKLSKNLVEKERLKYIANKMNDDNCFNMITIEEAYSYFRDLGFNYKDYKNIYIMLVK